MSFIECFEMSKLMLNLLKTKMHRFPIFCSYFSCYFAINQFNIYVNEKTFLSGMREPVPPILNEKLIQMTTKIGESLIIPCVAYANPRASYR